MNPIAAKAQIGKLKITTLLWTGLREYASQLAGDGGIGDAIAKTAKVIEERGDCPLSPLLVSCLSDVLASIVTNREPSRSALVGLGIGLIDYALATDQGPIEVPIVDWPDSTLYLISSGFKLEMPDGGLLVKVSPGSGLDLMSIGTVADNPSYTISRLPRIIGSDAVCAGICSQMYWDERTARTICTGMRAETELVGGIEAALKVLESHDAACCDDVRRNIRCFVPISSPSDRIHCSFTNPRLPGAMFLSVSKDELQQAEAIVHEYGHYELSLAAQLEPLAHKQKQSLFYSPWRMDPRPLEGLLHAAYVIAGVMTFLSRIARKAPEPLCDVAVRRMTVQGARLKVAHAELVQLRHSKLGEEIIEVVEGALQMSEPIIANRLTHGLKTVRAHFNAWKLANPLIPVSLSDGGVSDGVLGC